MQTAFKIEKNIAIPAFKGISKKSEDENPPCTLAQTLRDMVFGDSILLPLKKRSMMGVYGRLFPKARFVTHAEDSQNVRVWKMPLGYQRPHEGKSGSIKND